MRCADKRSFDSILGLSYKDIFGLPRNNPERPMKGPDCISLDPVSSRPGRKISSAVILRQTHRRASRQHRLPFQLQLLRGPCRVWNNEKMESPERTVAILSIWSPPMAPTPSSSTT